MTAHDALTAMLAYFGPAEDDLKDLLDPDYWEGSYRSKPSAEYRDYWKVINDARHALGWVELRWTEQMTADERKSMRMQQTAVTVHGEDPS